MFGWPANWDKTFSMVSMLFADTSMAMFVSMPNTMLFWALRSHSVFSYESNCVVCIFTSWVFRNDVICAIFAVACFMDSAALLSNVVTRKVMAVLSLGAVVRHSPLTEIVRGCVFLDLADHTAKTATTATIPTPQTNFLFMSSLLCFVWLVNQNNSISWRVSRGGRCRRQRCARRRCRGAEFPIPHPGRGPTLRGVRGWDAVFPVTPRSGIF